MARRLVLAVLTLAVIAGLVVAELATSGSDQSSRAAPALPSQVLHGPKDGPRVPAGEAGADQLLGELVHALQAGGAGSRPPGP